MALFVIACILIPVFLANTAKQTSELLRDKSPWAIELVRPILKLYVHLVSSNKETKHHRGLSRKLATAGQTYSITPKEFVVLKYLVAMIFLSLSGLWAYLHELQITTKIAVPLVTTYIGYIYPDIWLKDTITNRKNSIEKQFPFFLDILVLSMKSGLTFNKAVNELTEKLPDSPLKYEILKYQRDIRTGKKNSEALEALADRCDLSSISNFVSSIIQGEESGGSVTKALAEQAKQRRKERFLRAEKKANEAPVKMLAPLVGLLFPTTFIILAVPIYVQLTNSGIIDKF